MAEKEKHEIASDDGVADVNRNGREAGLVPDFPTFGFDVKSEKCDLVLIVENYCLYVKRSHLALFSPVLETMLEDNCGETLTIEDVKCSDFAEFLACIQPRKRQKVSKGNVFRMVKLAKSYDVDDLIDRCEDCMVELLQKSKIEIQTIALFLDYAFKFDLETLKSECLKLSTETNEGALNDKKTLEKLDVNARCQLFEACLPKLTTKARLADIFLTSLKKEERQLISGISETRGLVIIDCESSSSSDPQSYNLFIWGIKWKLKIKFPSSVGGNSTRRYISFEYEPERVERHEKRKKFTCPIMVSAVIANHILWNEDKTVVQLIQFDSSKSVCDASKQIYLREDVDDELLGFKLKGKLSLNVQLLFGKPVYYD